MFILRQLSAVGRTLECSYSVNYLFVCLVYFVAVFVVVVDFVLHGVVPK